RRQGQVFTAAKGMPFRKTSDPAHCDCPPPSTSVPLASQKISQNFLLLVSHRLAANLTRKPPQKPLGATGKSMARSDYGERRAAVAPATNSHSEEDIMRTAASRNGTAAAPTNPESSRDLSTKRRRTKAKAWAKQVTETQSTEGQLALLSARAN